MMSVLLPRLLQLFSPRGRLGLVCGLCVGLGLGASLGWGADAPQTGDGSGAEDAVPVVAPQPEIATAEALQAYLHDSVWSFCEEPNGPEQATMTFFCEGENLNLRYFHNLSDSTELTFAVADPHTLTFEAPKMSLTFSANHRDFVLHDWPTQGCVRYGCLKRRLHPAPCQDAPMANTHWTDGGELFIQFYSDGTFHEKWGKIHYRGVWRPQQKQECMVFRGDGKMYHFTLLDDGARLWRNDRVPLRPQPMSHTFTLNDGRIIKGELRAVNLPGDQAAVRTEDGQIQNLPEAAFTLADRLYLQQQGMTYGLDGPDREQDFRLALRRKFLHGQYHELEVLAKRLRETEERFPGGDWKLSAFYKAFDARYDDRAEGWDQSLSHMEAWLQASPDSPVAKLAAASILQRRGAQMVGTDRQSLLKRAAGLLESCAADASNLPEWYSVQMEQGGVAVERWAPEARLTLCVECASRFPRYVAPLAAAAYSDVFTDGADPAPLWQILREAESREEAHNEGAAARIFSWFCLFRNSTPHRIRVERLPMATDVWPLLRDSFRQLLNAYPETQWYRHEYAYTASVMGDREAAAEAFRDLPKGEEPAYIWQDSVVRDLMERWAMNPGDPLWRRPAPVFCIHTDERLAKLAFSSDGKMLAAGFAGEKGGQVGVWKVDPEVVDLHTPPDFQPLPSQGGALGGVRELAVTGLQWSDDATTLAATIAPAVHPASGLLRVWTQEKGSFTPLCAVERPQWLRGLAFDSNGEDLFVMAGPDTDMTDVLRVKIPSGTAITVYQRDKLFKFQAGAGRVAVSGARFSFAWSEGEVLPKPAGLSMPDSDPGWIRALAFAPDGKTLISAGGGDSGTRWMRGWVHRMSLDRNGSASPLQHDVPMASVSALVVDATRNWLIAGGWDGTLTIWNLKTSALVCRFPVLCDGAVQALAVSGNGAWLAVSDPDHQRMALYRMADLEGNADGKEE